MESLTSRKFICEEFRPIFEATQGDPVRKGHSSVVFFHGATISTSVVVRTSVFVRTVVDLICTRTDIVSSCCLCKIPLSGLVDLYGNETTLPNLGGDLVSIYLNYRRLKNRRNET